MSFKLIIFNLIGLNFAMASDYELYLEANMHYKFHLEPKTWFEAVQICKDENATLAMPENDVQAKILKNIFESYPPSKIKGATWQEYMLLGFHDTYNENEYLTLKDVPIQYFYHTWHTGQPDNFFNEDCGSLHRDGKINDVSCQAKCVFTCQKSEKEDRSKLGRETICSSSDSAYKCSNELERCFKLHLNPHSWGVARQICESEGGSLAMIYNGKEEHYLKQMFNDELIKSNQAHFSDYALLGFHDLFKEGDFITLDGKFVKHLEYTKWLTKSSNIIENCGAFHKTGHIGDVNCNHPAPFFCQRSTLDVLSDGFDVRASIN